MNSIILFYLLITFFLSSIKPILNHETHMIYKNCTSMPNNFPPQTFTNLFQELTSHSSKTNHYTTTIGDQNQAISGRFQCRNDLTTLDCHNCVKQLAKISTTLCGQSIPARIHLSGCYSHFELDEPAFKEFSRLALQHKACGGGGANMAAFEAARDDAFVAAERGATEKGYYYETSREGMKVMAQCDGSLMEGCDCGECVSNAVEVAMDECGNSFSGEVYLYGCFLIYVYKNSGISYLEDNEMGGIGTNKIVAIVLGGGVFLVGIVFLVCYYKSWKKRNDYI